ncbi:MAG TPA: HAD-IA family hydrolase [Chitinophagaceae bacterium]|nr:HAD-IA family hydrolase [Chitinophagaceae bacterium]
MVSCFNKIIFFDIGGVLLTNGWGHESRQAAAAKFGFDYEEMNILHEFIFNVYEIGKISLDEYLNTTLFHRPRNFTKETFIDFMLEQSVELPGTLQWLIQWKKQHRGRFRFISINNEGKELNDYRIQKFQLHECFDAFVSSCEVGMRKPDPGIFRLAMGIAQASPEQCIYFDDRQILVDAAAKTGMDCHRHKGLESTKAILESLL